MTATAVLRQATATERSGFAPLLALRPAAGIAAGLVVGVATGHVVTGVSLAAGAIPVGAASLVGRFKAPVLLLLVTCAATGLSTFAGSLSSNLFAVHLVLLVAWGFAAGMCVALGPVPAVVATQAVVAYVVFGRFPLPAHGAAVQGLLIAAGGLVQVAIVSTVRGRGRFRAERRATGAVYAALADLALADDRPGTALPSAEALAEAQAVVARSWAGPGSTAREAFRELHVEAARLRLDLVALAGARTRLDRLGAADLVAEIDRFGLAAAARLRAVGAAIRDGEDVPDAALDVPRDREVDGFDAYAAWWFATARMAAVAGQLRAAARMTVPRDRHHTRGRPTPPAELRAALGVLRANARPGSTTFRHATRLGAVLPIGLLVAHYVSSQRGYWVPLTELLVLKPDFATTTSRGVARVAGTAVGVVLATLIGVAVHPHGWDLVVIVALMAWAMFATLSANYGLFSVFNAVLVVFLIGAAVPDTAHLALERLVETGLGGTLAFLGFLVYPAWQGARLAPLVRDLLAAQSAYLGSALGRLSGTPTDLRAAADHARVARSNVETALVRIDAEPTSRRGDPATARAVVGAAGRMVRAGHELAALPESPALQGIRPFGRDLVRALDALAASVVDGGRPTVPDLRAAFDRLRDDLAVDPGDRAEAARREIVVEACDQLVDAVDLARDVLARRGGSNPG